MSSNRSEGPQAVAVIGLSCRFPGAHSPEEMWRLLDGGVDALGEVPDGRWPGAGPEVPRRAGFLDGIDAFDADCFGIPPAEAAAMDPHQRLGLELAWEALEHARIAPPRARNSATGVFIGAINNDFAVLQARAAGAAGRHDFTGSQRSMLANRISYHLGLRGASLTVDAGQSSSLLAVQLAADALRRGEIDTAIAGGVNLNLLAGTGEALTRFGALSPDGRCYTFDARANGYARGEGGALVVLKLLDRALADGDPVRAVLLGGAVNNDGGGDGLTVPRQAAQEAVLRQAYRAAGVDPGAVQYVELHGTGTKVGDPVEAAALGGALSAGRDDGSRLLVGSVKTNIGHLEGAAGVAGLVKVILSLTHRRLPATLNFASAPAGIPLGELGLEPVTGSREWPRPDQRLVAGVSSFGLGGTNCHLVLAEAPAASPASSPTTADALATDDAPWLLSARSAPALAAQAGRLATFLAERPAVAASEVTEALAAFRATGLPHRAAVDGPDRDARSEALRALATGEPHLGVTTGRARTGGTVLVFPGQGSQWAGMAAGLIDAEPVFAARLAACDGALAAYCDFSVTDVLRQAPGAPGLERVDVVQPALWAVMVSLAALWASRGVTPDAVVGHSQGEIAAATAVGALSLDDGARVVALRSQAIRAISGGGMLSVAAALDELTAELETGRVTVAAVNGPRSVVLSGPIDELQALRARLGEAGRRTKLLPVDYASHSVAVDVLREAILERLAPIRPVSVTTEFVSTLTGGPIDTARLDAGYWFASLRRPVRFADAIAVTLAADCAVFLECSPHPVLAGGIEETAAAHERDVAVLGTLRRDQPAAPEFRRALAEASVVGAVVTWPRSGRRPDLDLPTYAFARRAFPLPEPGRVTRARRPRRAVAAEPVSRPVTGSRDLVLTLLAQVLGHADAGALDPAATFRDLGLDSAGALELSRRLAAAVGATVLSSTVFDFPTPQKLAGHLDGLRSGDTAEFTLEAAEQEPYEPDEPIAIVAMACRYPGGVTSPEDLWRLLAAGGDAITPFPVNRGWDLDTLLGGPAEPGLCTTEHGGFLHDADRFDAAFFGLSPREARAMDPQQRLMLEIGWEALERAGIDPADLAGSPAGVFVGAMATDYGPRLHDPHGDGGGHLLTGTALSVASGRVAYTLGLRGPAVTVDTACSSSLVAVQLAASALRSGECALALAGGVTVMANPGNLVEFSRQNGLAPDGRVKAFGAGADGTAFAEGAGVLLLERLSDAQRLGHPVLAVVTGAAVNSDGASNGLTAPNGEAQQQVIRQALDQAGLAPSDVDVVEAHGTGTALGDPVEAHAVLATYGQRGPQDRPVLLGSVKSNLGHTQAAAGVAGVIKLVLALRHGELPATLRADEPSTRIDWTGGRAELLTRPHAWPARAGAVRRAAVSSFGISGTNAHVVIEEAPAGPAPAVAPDRPLTWVLSARTATALREQAGRLLAWIPGRDDEERDDADLASAGVWLARRHAFARRAAVVAADRAELTAALTALAGGRPHPALVEGTAAAEVSPVLVFPGQGSQWEGMAVDLLDADDTFAAAVARCDEALRPHTGWSVRDVLRGAPGAPELVGSPVIQPVLFAVMVGLAEVWRAAGVEPAAVVGHSQGEIAAACVSGALSLDDAARVAARRSQVLSALDGTGSVLTVSVGPERAAELIAAWPGQLWVAVENGPASTVVAGDLDAAAAFVATHGGQVQIRPTALDYASHTPHVAAVRDELLEALAGLTPGAAGVPVFSSTRGAYVPGPELDAAYWYENLAGKVRFRAAVRSLAELPAPVFIEASPHSVLAHTIADVLAENDRPGATVGSLRRNDADRRRLALSMATAWTAGVGIRWAELLAPAGRDGGAPPEGLPTYPFERERHWLTSGREPAGPGHPLLERALLLAGDGRTVLTGRVSLRSAAWAGDHRIAGAALLPGTAIAELALAAAAEVGLAEVTELTLEAPLVLPESGAVDLQLEIGAPDGTGRQSLTLRGRASTTDDDAWTQHASGLLGPAAAAEDADPGPWPPLGAEPLAPAEAVYDHLAGLGYGYGPAFRGLTRAWASADGRFAEVALPDTVDDDGFGLHPALLDSALHVLIADRPAGARVLPFAFTGARVLRPGTRRVRVSALADGDDAWRITLSDETGAVVATTGVVLRPDRGSAPAAGLERLEWQVIELTDRDGPARWAVLGDGARADRISDALRAGGAGGTVLYDLASAAEQSSGVPDVVVVPWEPDPVEAREDPAWAVQDGVQHVLDLAQQWLADERFATSRLLVATPAADLVTAPVWGLIRSAVSEHPDRFALADVTTDDETAWRAARNALAAGHTRFAVRDDRVLTARLAPLPEPDEPRNVDLTDGTVLVTGGTSGLGALVAEHLVRRHGVRDLLLVSRRGPAAEGAGDLRDRLAESGARVRVVAADVTDPRGLADVVSSVEPPLVGVVHAAGALADGAVATLSPDRLDTALRPKVQGAWLLHELTADLPLRVFVLFSSVAGVIGTAGQAGYAAANAFLDGLARRRRREGLPAVSVAWGLWETATGMTGHLTDADRARLAAAGLRPLGTEQGLARFDDALRADGDVVAAVWGAQPRRPRATVTAVTAVTAVAPVAPAGEPAPGLAARLSGLPAQRARATVLELVRAQVAVSLGYSSPGLVDPEKSFSEMGFDSLTSVELRNRLTAETGLRLPSTLVFNRPTVAALTEHLVEELVPPAPAPDHELRAVLDSLAGRLAEAGDDDRDRVVTLLRSALQRFAGPDLDLPAPPASLGEASDEEIFDFIDQL